MAANVRVTRFIPFLAVILLQLFMTQVVTFLFSVLLPGMETMSLTNPVLFVVIVGIAFSAGVFVAGWLALSRGWLKLKTQYLARLAGALLGAYVPLIVALIVYPVLEPGNPFYLVSMLCSILGFYVPGWLVGK